MKTIAIVGFGHIGASLARAWRRAGVVERILAVDHDPTVLERALSRGWADEATMHYDECGRADAALLALPVRSIVEVLPLVVSAMPPGGLLLDVASTKGVVVRAFQELDPPLRYVSLHPLAGTERSGIDSADPDIFRGMPFLVLPIKDADEAALRSIDLLVNACAGRALRVSSAEEHDAALAVTIHLPHVLAYALTHEARQVSADLGREIFDLAGRSFRDSTRVAASNVRMVHEFLTTNPAHTAAAIERLTAHLEEIKRLLLQGEEEKLRGLMDTARRIRERLSGIE